MKHSRIAEGYGADVKDTQISNLKVISVNIGLPQTIEWDGKPYETGIVKTAKDGRLAINTLNLEGDGQSDLSAHGGRDKAVYCYASEYYLFWGESLPDVEFPWGAFGENLTTKGLVEEDVYVGDRLKIGTAEFEVTEPRFPCSKLNAVFRRNDILKLFWKSARFGWYMAVLKEGDVGAGDQIELMSRGDGPSIGELVMERVNKRVKEEAATVGIVDKAKSLIRRLLG